MKTLILNVDYTPLNTVHIKRALILTIKKGAKVLAYYDKEFKSEKGIHKIPAVILYDKYIYRPLKRSPTRYSVLSRDKMICQYCECKLDNRNATIDHVIPVSMYKNKNDANTWENMVACCRKCNTKKGDRTPHQAGITLIKKPKRPYHFLVGGNIPKEWEDYAGE